MNHEELQLVLQEVLLRNAHRENPKLSIHAKDFDRKKILKKLQDKIKLFKNNGIKSRSDYFEQAKKEIMHLSDQDLTQLLEDILLAYS
jgi:hypothetical protein